MRLLALALLLLSSATMHAAEIPPDKEIIYFENAKLGGVTFLHKMHASLQDVECTTCHHRGVGETPPEDCHNCHTSKPTDDTPKAIKAFHVRCRGCHQYTVEAGKKAGPVKKCTLCHVKEGR